MTDKPTTPSAEERAARMIGRLGTLVAKAMNIDGAGAGIALSKQEAVIADEIRAAEAAARENFAREVIGELRALADRLEETLP